MRIPTCRNVPGIRRVALEAAFASVSVLWMVQPTPAAAQDHGFVPDDIYRVVEVSAPAISPGGDYVAFSVTTTQEREDSRSTAIWLLALENGQPVGEGRPYSGGLFDSASPIWSPDGSLLAFRSRRGADPNPVWFARTRAPGGEAFHVEGVRGLPLWSPDGRRIAFLARPEGTEQEAEVRIGAVSPDAISRPTHPERFDGHVITHLNHLQDGSPDPTPHPSAVPPEQLFVVPAGGGEAVQLTAFTHRVIDAVWSPHGDALFVIVDESDGEDVRPRSRASIFRIEADGAGATRVTEGGGYRSSLAISPDGAHLAYRYTADYGAPDDILLLPVGTPGSDESPRNLTSDWPLSPRLLGWSPDGGRVRFLGQTGGSTHLFEVDVASGEVRQVTTGKRQIGPPSFTADGRWMAFTSTDPTHPPEVHAARSDATRERRLTSFNHAWLSARSLREPERLTWRVADGTRIEGWVIPPLVVERGTEYPAVLSIHGGPHAAYGYRFSEHFQSLSAAGFYVFYLNPRGSSGYGDAFQWAIEDGWGAIEEEDFVTGIEHLIARYPQVDPDRIGVTGWSYGGFMTNWLTARTDLFAAAVTGASVTDWESDAGTTDIWYTIHNEFGPLWEARDVYRRLSPLSYVENVTAPTLILHGQFDIRVPYKNAEQWFRALKMRGVPVELVRYPDVGHVLRRPWHQVDRVERTLAWFEHWLKGESPGIHQSAGMDRH